MTRPNITPGPWHVSNIDQIWDETGDIKIAEICELPRIYIAGSMRPNSEQETANSKAIAAVPALLELAEACQHAEHLSEAELRTMIHHLSRSTLAAAGYQF